MKEIFCRSSRRIWGKGYIDKSVGKYCFKIGHMEFEKDLNAFDQNQVWSSSREL